MQEIIAVRQSDRVLLLSRLGSLSSQADARNNASLSLRRSVNCFGAGSSSVSSEGAQAKEHAARLVL